MKKIALLFAGQGSQSVGMGKEFYDKYQEVQNIYDKASMILGYDIKEILFTENKLINQTEYTQPAILVTSLGIYHSLVKETNIYIHAVCGFSLGEYSAMYIAGIFTFDDIVRLISQRAKYMEECSKKNPGKMAAIIGLDRENIQKICQDVSEKIGLVSIANYNSPEQFVIGGITDAVHEVCIQAKNIGAKRTILLNVSGGFHTALMHEAAVKIKEIVKKINYQKPKTKIVMNATGDYLSIDELPRLMEKQIESSVYFEDSLRRMIADGIDTFIEIGPGQILSGLCKKIDHTKTIMSINNICDLERVKEWI